VNGRHRSFRWDLRTTNAPSAQRREIRKPELLSMRVHLVNPSDASFGIGVITPRWLYVLAAAAPAGYGNPCITDETLEQIDSDLQPGDIVGIGIHTGNALRGMQVGRMARERGAKLLFSMVGATGLEPVTSCV
jgi:hypothetical protein